MSIDSLTYKQAKSKLEQVVERLQQIPTLVAKQVSSVQQKEMLIDDLERERALLNIGIWSDDEKKGEHREFHHVSMDIKSAKGALVAHKSEVDKLRSEQSHLLSIKRQLEEIVVRQEGVITRQVASQMNKQLDDEVVEKARDAFADLIIYVAIKEGGDRPVPQSINRDGAVGKYLEQWGDRLLEKRIEQKYSRMKEDVQAAVMKQYQ